MATLFSLQRGEYVTSVFLMSNKHPWPFVKTCDAAMCTREKPYAQFLVFLMNPSFTFAASKADSYYYPDSHSLKEYIY